jgi:hypothetical protein
VSILFCSVASADTYQFPYAKGSVRKDHPVNASPRCVSAAAEKRVRDIAKLNPKFTVGHGQMTMTWFADGKQQTTAADDVVETFNKAKIPELADATGIWHIQTDSATKIDMKVRVEPFGPCTEALTCATHVPQLTVDAIQSYDAMYCYEEWQSTGVKLGDGAKP